MQLLVSLIVVDYRNRSLHILNFGELLFRLEPNQTSYARNLEKIRKRSVQANNGVVFNKICVKENLLCIQLVFSRDKH